MITDQTEAIKQYIIEFGVGVVSEYVTFTKENTSFFGIVPCYLVDNTGTMTPLGATANIILKTYGSSLLS